MLVSRPEQNTFVHGLTFAAENYRQIPQLSHVERLKHLPLVRRSISVETDGDVVRAHVLLCEGQACTDRHLCANDTITTVEVLVVHVDRASFSTGNTFPPTENFAYDFSGCGSSH